MEKKTFTAALLSLLLVGCDDTLSSLGAEASSSGILTIAVSLLVMVFGLAVYLLVQIKDRRDEDNRRNADDKKYRQVFETISVPTALVSNSAFIDCNSAFERMLGYSRDDIIGRPPWDFMPEKQPDGEYSRSQVLTKSAKTIHGQAQHFIRRYLNADGAPLDLEVTLDSVDIDGVPHILSSFQDITDQKRINQDIEDINAVLRAVLDRMPLGIFVALGQRRNWRLEIVNDKALEITGLSREQAENLRYRGGAPVGDTHERFTMRRMDGTEIAVGESPLGMIMERGIASSGEVLFLERADGETLTLEVNTSAVSDSKGKSCGATAVFADITERRQVEDSLTEAKVFAEQANLTKNEFLANMSHELRTPLNAVLGMLQLLKRTDDEQEREEFVDIALKSGRSLLTILSDILDMTMIETGTFEIRDEGVNIPDLLSTVAESFELQARDKDIEIGYVVDPSVPEWIVCDASRVRQILFNLVGNAVKFTQQGSVRIEASLFTQDDDLTNHRLYFTVSDTGIGISDEKLGSIFDPFMQEDGSMTRAHGGAGLGLSIAKRLVNKLGGEIAIESERDRGTTFHFALRAKPAFDTETKKRPEAESKPPRAVDFSKAKVLLVEDDEDMQYLGIRFLKEFGVAAELAANGELALEMLQRGEFTMVLMDVQMPVMDGLEATKRIRSGEYHELDRDIPIIAMTAHAMRGDRERFLAAGMNDYISKPVDELDLLHALRRYALPRRENTAAENTG